MKIRYTFENTDKIFDALLAALVAEHWDGALAVLALADLLEQDRLDLAYLRTDVDRMRAASHK
jgi:hypothetical protein